MHKVILCTRISFIHMWCSEHHHFLITRRVCVCVDLKSCGCLNLEPRNFVGKLSSQLRHWQGDSWSSCSSTGYCHRRPQGCICSRSQLPRDCIMVYANCVSSVSLGSVEKVMARGVRWHAHDADENHWTLLFFIHLFLRMFSVCWCSKTSVFVCKLMIRLMLRLVGYLIAGASCPLGRGEVPLWMNAWSSIFWLKWWYA